MYKAYQHYLGAGMFDEAHDIACKALAPEAVLQGDIDLLERLFSKVRKSTYNDGTNAGR
jgi:nuclear pore complex protein Nup98-Nup96